MLPLKTPRLIAELNRAVLGAFLGPGSITLSQELDSLVEGGRGHLPYPMPLGIPLGTPGLGSTFPGGQDLHPGGA